jgi:hypothetical protein
MEVDGGLAHSKESRPWSKGLTSGSGGIAARNDDLSCSQGEEEDFCKSERKEEKVVVSGMGVAGWWLS